MNPRLPDTPPPPDDDPTSTRWYAFTCLATVVATVIISWLLPWPWFGVVR